MESNLVRNRSSDQQNLMTAKRESDFSIMRMTESPFSNQS